MAGIRAEYEEVRRARGTRDEAARGVPFAEAQANRLVPDVAGQPATTPTFLGTRVLEDYPLPELVDRIDWTPFFQTWELKGRYPAILEDPAVGETARSLFADAQALLGRICDEGLLTARGVFGFWPAHADGDDIVLFGEGDRQTPLATIHTLRQQMRRQPGSANLALADFVAPAAAGVPDFVGAFAVTTGIGVDALVAEFESRQDDYNAILAKALADRLAEAFAERLHERVRREFWAYTADEALDNEALIHEAYQGIRPAPGYPACPDHTEKATLFRLLDAESRIGLRLTENFAMWPAAAVSGLYFWRPEARYFGVGRIGRDQVEDYARRKEMTVAETERWLAPNLGYER
jgi:5-methyltetrahydrofolate--homocysteine methyltransferase